MAQELAAGVVVADRYRLERLLGEGGMGAVWSASHVLTRKRVALKFLKGAVAGGSDTLLKRFLREARAASAVNHPNVVAIHDIVQLPDGLPVMVMDLLNGCSLAEKIARDRVMPLSELAEVLVPVLSAVGTAHAAGIVHRDLKPDNIFLHMRADGDMEPKVLDFGIAKLSATEGEAAATAHLTQTGALLGTPYYMSPEQVFGEKDIDQRADVWSMGVILYECLSGTRPLEGENFGQLFKAIATGSVVPLEQVAPHLPVEITALVGRMLQVDRSQRPQDLRESYEILLRHSSTKSRSFAGVATPSPGTLTSGPGTGELAFEATSAVEHSIPGAQQSTSGVFSRTSPPVGEAYAVPVRRTWPLAAAALVAVAVIGTGGWLLVRSPSAPAASSEPSDRPPPIVAATAAPHLDAPDVTPANPAPPTSAGAAPATSARTAPRASGSPRPAAPAAGKPATPAEPVASAKPAESAKPAPTKLPGSVVGDVPF